MKKLLLIFLLIPQICFGAIAATTVWEIQQDATANNVNGCGYNASNVAPGTDRSQTTAAYKDHDDLVTPDGDAVPCTITSAAHAFTSGDNGNLIHITAGTGFTTGWYEVVSVDGSNIATLDRACGSDGEKTGGTYYLGGACSLNSTLDDDLFESGVAGNIWFVKYNASVILLGESVDLTIATGSATNTIKIIGYDTTRTVLNTNINRPTISNAAYTFGTGGLYFIKGLIWNATGTSTLTTKASDVVYNCKIYNTGTATKYAITGTGSAVKIINNEIYSTNGNAVEIGSTAWFLYGNYIYNSVKCINYLGGGVGTFVSNIFDNCSTAGVASSTYEKSIFVNNTFYGVSTTAGTGFLGTTSVNNLFINNIFDGWGTGFTTTTAAYDSNIFINNDFYNNDINKTNAASNSVIGDVTTDPTFTAGDEANFMIGTNLKAGAFPSIFPGSSTNNYLDIGAAQRVESGGGSWAY